MGGGFWEVGLVFLMPWSGLLCRHGRIEAGKGYPDMTVIWYSSHMTFHMAVHCDLVGYVQIEIASSWGGFPHIWLQFLGKGWCGLFHTRFQNISSSNKGDHGRAGLQDLHLLLLLAGSHLLLPPPPDGGDVAGVPLHRRRRRARLVVEGSHYSWRRRPRENWSKSRNEN